jgi:hypothetical protein
MNLLLSPLATAELSVSRSEIGEQYRTDTPPPMFKLVPSKWDEGLWNVSKAPSEWP